MRLRKKLLRMNLTALAGCALLLFLLHTLYGAERLGIFLVAALLALGLANTFAFLIPHLARSPRVRQERWQLGVTLALLTLAGLLGWMWFRR